MSGLVKNKLLGIARTGVFVHFDNAKITEIYSELKQLLVSGDTIQLDELFSLYELHVYLSLITSHDVEAKSYIDKIIDQFGEKNSERITLLKSLYLESEGDRSNATKLLSENQDELRLSRRLLTFNRSNTEEYIKNLNFYLNIQPADLITWAELADQYKKIGHYDKSIFCLKEILLQEPLEYNIFYRIGVLYYYSYLQNYTKDVTKKEKLLELVSHLTNARNSFLRTLEICKDHKASWVGVYRISTLKDLDNKLKKYPQVKEFTSFQQDSAKLLDLSGRKVVELNGIRDTKELKDFIY